MKMSVRNLISEERGLTLMELIISIAMLSIIAIASMYGLAFAYNAIFSSEEYMVNVYQTQALLESDLSHISDLESSDDAVSIASDLGINSSETDDEIIQFDWGTDGSTTPGDKLRHFQSEGVTVKRNATGGSYIDDEIYIFFPVNNTNWTP